jgi:hypothetical protein
VADQPKLKLAQERREITCAIEQRGYIFEVIGDAVCTAFPSAEYAIQAAIFSPVSIRRTGEAVSASHEHPREADLRENGLYFGSLLSHVRDCDAGHGGQSCSLDNRATETTFRLVSRCDLGEHRLRMCPIRASSAIIDELPENFPPYHLDSSPNNPIQLTSFIGRKKELADVRRLLPHTHLLTLTGPGGTGKSRLAIQTAMNLLETFPHGAWLVELAPVSDPSQVTSATLAALDLPAEVHRPATDMLCDYLHENRLCSFSIIVSTY